jgi:hypothetical protein
MRFLILALGLIISSCQSYSENGFMSDISSLVKCPANGCADQTPNQNEMTVSYGGPRPIQSPSGDQSIQIGGDCYASTFPDNTIISTALDQFGNPLSGIAFSAVNGATLRCVNGRYNVMINATNLTAPGNYRIRFQLVASDVSGQTFTSPTAVVEVPVQRYVPVTQ